MSRLTEYQDIIKARISSIEGVDVGDLTQSHFEYHLAQKTFSGINQRRALRRLVYDGRDRVELAAAKQLLIDTVQAWQAGGSPVLRVRQGDGVIGLVI